MQNSMRSSVTLKLTLTLNLTLTDTGGAVLTLKPHDTDESAKLRTAVPNSY